MLTMIAPLLPLLLDTVPARIAPKGPPIANTDTAIDHSAVVCPGNTTGSGAFCFVVVVVVVVVVGIGGVVVFVGGVVEMGDFRGAERRAGRVRDS